MDSKIASRVCRFPGSDVIANESNFELIQHELEEQVSLHQQDLLVHLRPRQRSCWPLTKNAYPACTTASHVCNFWAPVTNNVDFDVNAMNFHLLPTAGTLLAETARLTGET